ncbi:MAG: hypothetical protein R3C11_17245 [Planctomycetaceae bacterium]
MSANNQSGSQQLPAQGVNPNQPGTANNATQLDTTPSLGLTTHDRELGNRFNTARNENANPAGFNQGSNANAANNPTAPAGSNQVDNFNPRNPFLSNQQNADAGLPSNSADEPAAFDPGAGEEFGDTNTIPPLANNNAFPQPSSGVSNSGFETDGFGQDQSGNNIVPLSGTLDNGSAAINRQQSNQLQPQPQQPLRQQPQSQQPANSDLTWQSAVKLLNNWGIDNFVLQPGAEPGSFHFSCYHTPANNSRITVRYEAESTEPLKAVENVLLQIQQRHIEQQKQGQFTGQRQ